MISKTDLIWDNLYQIFEKNKDLGIRYPVEALVIYVSTLRKNKKSYFTDRGKEFSTNNNFNGKALEIGFGSIANLVMLHEKGFKCYGAEVSKEAVKRGRISLKKKKLHKKILLDEFHDEKLDYKHNSFDLVCGLSCIYYNLDLKKFMEENIYKILKPGGKFIFSFFAKDHTYFKYTKKLGKNLACWSKNHPNKRLVGAKFYFTKNKKTLLNNFKIFKNVRLFSTKSDQTVFNESWWYVVGEK